MTIRSRHELKVEETLSAADGVELGMASRGNARARVYQTLHEFALVGLRAGLSYAQMSAFTGIPEDDLAKQVEDYHRLTTT